MALLDRLWPKNMAGQIALLVGLALLVAQAINFALLVRARDRQELIQVAAPAIARLADAIERDAAGTPMVRERGPWLSRRGVFVENTSRITADMPVRDDVVERARVALHDLRVPVLRIQAAQADGEAVHLPASGRVAQVRDTMDPGRRNARPFLIVAAEVEPGRWINLVTRLPSRDPRFLGWLLLQTMILYGLVMAAVLWSVRRISRPLRELTGAVEGFRSAGNNISVPESGPSDVRRLVTAYNGMRTRIAGLLDEKDRMLGAIGHDLRTPLASLRVRAEGMEDEVERDRMAATIEEMNRTLDDILSLARLGRPSEAETRVDLSALLDQVVDDFQTLGADVSLAETPRTTVTIRPTLVTRALRNLIDNAVKYGTTATVDIVSEPGGVAVTIDDVGPGIPEDKIETMFEPFTRLEQSRSRETGGTGLGLALAKAIALQHGGRLTLENRTPHGLRATLWLPN
jgi:signal transduction histidine kinase